MWSPNEDPSSTEVERGGDIQNQARKAIPHHLCSFLLKSKEPVSWLLLWARLHLQGPVVTVHENKGTEILGQSVNRMEIALQEMSSVNQPNFIPECREYIRLENLGTNPNLHQVACSYHKTLHVTVRSYSKAPSTSLSNHMCKASSRKLFLRHDRDKSGIQV